MFIYFNENKLAYHKGQLAPFFIVVIILLLIAALVTVNIGKVGLIKTHSSNAADAGALAGGSVMATVFNTQAVMNSEMIVAYETFYASMAVLMGVISVAMWAAAGACAVWCCPCGFSCCCCPSPGCARGTGIAIRGFQAAIVALLAFQSRQFFYYKTMKRQAMDGRDDAIEAAYRYAFLNSGISSQLKSCRLEDTSGCDSCEEACERDCQARCGNRPDDPGDQRNEYNECRDVCAREELNCLINNCQSQWAEFQLRLKDIESGPSAEYTWLDGQGRNHHVHVNVETEEVGTYRLRLPIATTYHLVSYLYFGLTAAMAANRACSFCFCTAGFIAAAGRTTDTWGLMYLAGLIPVWNFDASGFVTIMWPISWITDINHDRLLTVTTWQEHEGQDYGVMGQTTYPHIESYSQTDFRGNGEIYEPNPRFDVTIIRTDQLEGE